MDTAALPLPPSLAATPNIELRDQTAAQLLAERAYWKAKVKGAAGPASASSASEFWCDCDREITRRRNIDADAVPNGWIPERFFDETVPPHRPTPTAWIVGPAAQPHVAIIAGDSDEMGEADETRSTLKIGASLSFVPFTGFPSVEITVQADGTWLSKDSVSPFANCFCDVDGDCLGDTMDEIARQLLDADPTAAALGVEVHAYRWGDPVVFTLRTTNKGRFVFDRASSGGAL